MNRNHEIPDDYVAISEHICPVCGAKHTHNTEVLVSKKLQSIPKDQRVTGYGLCEEHQKLFDDNFIAMIPISNDTEDERTTMKQEDAVRTGEIIHLKRHIFKDMFDANVPDEQEMVFIDQEVFNLLQGMQKDSI